MRRYFDPAASKLVSSPLDVRGTLKNEDDANKLFGLCRCGIAPRRHDHRGAHARTSNQRALKMRFGQIWFGRATASDPRPRPECCPTTRSGSAKDGRGSWRDNVFIERLWRPVKHEEVYLRAYDSVVEARSSLGGYLAFYNRKRPYWSLDGRSPDRVYFGRRCGASLRSGIHLWRPKRCSDQAGPPLEPVVTSE